MQKLCPAKVWEALKECLVLRRDREEGMLREVKGSRRTDEGGAPPWRSAGKDGLRDRGHANGFLRCALPLLFPPAHPAFAAYSRGRRTPS